MLLRFLHLNSPSCVEKECWKCFVKSYIHFIGTYAYIGQACVRVTVVVLYSVFFLISDKEVG